MNLRRAPVLVLLCSLLACAGSTDPDLCGTDGAVSLPDGSCLVFEGDLSSDHRTRIEAGVRSTLAAVNAVMPVPGVGIRARVAPERTIPEFGIGGYNPGKDEVILHLDPDSPRFETSLDDLQLHLAHELHHVARRRTVGYGSSLLQALVSEGLADHFVQELGGGDPPIWATALTDSAETAWRNAARATWNEVPYDHDAWFFGVGGPMPRWTGYTVGYGLVGDFLEANPDRTPSDLAGEPASSFLD
jgi:hypothetical protein